MSPSISLDSGTTSSPCWCQKVFIVFLFPGVFCPILSLSLFCFYILFFDYSLDSFVYHYLHKLSTLCPALRPLFFLLLIHFFFPPGPFWGHPSSFGAFDGPPLSIQPFPLLSLGEKIQSQLPSEFFGPDPTPFGPRENLLSALMPPSTPLPPHLREGADRSPGPLHSRQVPDRAIWGGWHRPPSRALRLHLWLWGRLS